MPIYPTCSNAAVSINFCSRPFSISVRLTGANITVFSRLDPGRIVAVNIWQKDIDHETDFYIRHCILYDYSRCRSHYFCCYTWFSLRKSINLINDVFYVAQEVDQYAFGHVFLSTFAWLYYHYHALISVFHKQRANSLPRIYRLYLYFSLVTIQIYVIQWILTSCRDLPAHQRCFSIFPPIVFVANQSLSMSIWSKAYQVNLRNDRA